MALRRPSSAGGGELVGREFGERAGAAVGRVHELEQIGIGRLEDVHHGAAVAARKPMLGYVPAHSDAIEAAVAAGQLTRPVGGERRLW